jgi:hypothetical protein
LDTLLATCAVLTHSLLVQRAGVPLTTSVQIAYRRACHMRYVDEHTLLPSCCLFCLPYPRRTRTAALTRFSCIAHALLRRCCAGSRHTTHSPTTPHIAHALTRDCPRWLPSFYACNSVSSPFFRSPSPDQCAFGRSLAPLVRFSLNHVVCFSPLTAFYICPSVSSSFSAVCPPST